MPISENIKLLRQRYNITQKELAEIAGVSDKAVSTWETGKNVPRMQQIERLAQHFGLQKSNLIEDSGMDPSYQKQAYPFQAFQPDFGQDGRAVESPHFRIGEGNANQTTRLLQLANQMTVEERQQLIDYAALIVQARQNRQEPGQKKRPLR